MNSKHKKTLRAIFKNPVPGNLPRKDIEAFLIATGAKVVEDSGSRVRFIKGEQIETFHRPHPMKEAKKYQVKMVRDFLIRTGEN